MAVFDANEPAVSFKADMVAFEVHTIVAAGGNAEVGKIGIVDEIVEELFLETAVIAEERTTLAAAQASDVVAAEEAGVVVAEETAAADEAVNEVAVSTTGRSAIVSAEVSAVTTSQEVAVEDSILSETSVRNSIIICLKYFSTTNALRNKCNKVVKH
jgi:hypothetical protein